MDSDNEEVIVVNQAAAASASRRHQLNNDFTRRRKRQRQPEIISIDDDDDDSEKKETDAEAVYREWSTPPQAARAGRLKNDRDYSNMQVVDGDNDSQDRKPAAVAQNAIINIDDDDDIEHSKPAAINLDDSDTNDLHTPIKPTPFEAAALQIQEIFPDMQPEFIHEQLRRFPNINAQSVELLIAHTLQNPSYPKLESKKPKSIKQKVDYANDEYERDDTYKKQCFSHLISIFPFLNQDGMVRLLKKCDGKYHKTYMYIVDKCKELKKGEENYVQYEEYLRLMNGGRLQEAQRNVFAFDDDGLKIYPTMKNPRRNRAAGALTSAVLQDEKRFTQSKIREWGRQVQKEKLRLAARKKAENEGTTVECTCCYGDYANEEMVSCQEGHLFCMDCLRRYAEERVFGNNDLGKKGVTELCCMDMSGCESWFNRNQLKLALSEKVMKKYDELQSTLVLEKAGLSDLVACPRCSFKVDLPESEMILECPECGYESCKRCGEPNHIPLRCSEVEKKTEVSARVQIEEAMTKARIRHCPKGCKEGFFKTEGCNKMTCPTCKGHMCYICRAEIPKNVGYKHFCQKFECKHINCGSCPLYSNSEQDDARATREAGLKVAESLKDSATTEQVAEKMEKMLKNEAAAASVGPTSTGAPAARQNLRVPMAFRDAAANIARMEAQVAGIEERMNIRAARRQRIAQIQQRNPNLRQVQAFRQPAAPPAAQGRQQPHPQVIQQQRNAGHAQIHENLQYGQALQRHRGGRRNPFREPAAPPAAQGRQQPHPQVTQQQRNAGHLQIHEYVQALQRHRGGRRNPRQR